jgi:hypothetical protein
MVSIGIIFTFKYMYTQFLHRIHLPTSFPCYLPLPLVPNPPWSRSVLHPQSWGVLSLMPCVPRPSIHRQGLHPKTLNLRLNMKGLF